MTARHDVHWDPTIPPEHRRALEGYLYPWLPLVPGWVETFRVQWEHSDRGHPLQVQLNYRNRWAIVLVGPAFLGQTPEDRECAVLHELAHVLLEPFAIALGRLVEHTVPEAMQPLAEQLARDGEEAVVEDMAHALLRARRAWLDGP